MAMDSRAPLLRSIRLENILSYGGKREPFELGPLNVLIGTNASGKSNLIEALALLAEAPRDILKPIREGGGVDEWLWKGGEPQPIAAIEVVCSYPPGSKPLLYRLAFSSVGGRFDLIDEVVCDKASDDPQRRFYYDYQEWCPGSLRPGVLQDGVATLLPAYLKKWICRKTSSSKTPAIWVWS